MEPSPHAFSAATRHFPHLLQTTYLFHCDLPPCSNKTLTPEQSAWMAAELCPFYRWNLHCKPCKVFSARHLLWSLKQPGQGSNKLFTSPRSSRSVRERSRRANVCTERKSGVLWRLLRSVCSTETNTTQPLRKVRMDLFPMCKTLDAKLLGDKGGHIVAFTCKQACI